MWRLFNGVLGWHYVAITSNCLGYSYIKRLRSTKDGRMYVEVISGKPWFLLDDEIVSGGWYTWIPLTWVPPEGQQ